MAEFYARTPVRMLIAADPGGSYDTNARLVGRHLGRHIPGNPRIIAETMVGASGRVAANYLYNVAPKDGSVIAIVQQSVPMSQATGEIGVQYDAARFNWIGSPILLDDVLVVWHTTGVRSMEDAKKKEVVIGATSPTGTNYIYPKLTNELLGTKFKIVTGYQGAAAHQARAATRRGRGPRLQSVERLEDRAARMGARQEDRPADADEPGEASRSAGRSADDRPCAQRRTSAPYSN